MTRVFTALPVPTNITLEITHPTTQDDSAPVRWVDPESAHLTLAFLGSLSDQDIEAAANALAHVVLPPILVELIRVESYPSRGNPRVIVVEPAENTRLHELHRYVRRSLEPWLQEDDRPYRPHITVGRIARGRGVNTVEIERAIASFLPRSFEANRFHLYASKTRPDRAHYSVLKDFPLAG